ncbi:MAG: GNAT family N-acetyltransferase [Chloroflexi bacterium]|nr:GNAT family N-acetyltransferase [Chloroflexota bacterium]MBP8054494.1 GNAT family N-acetyltransferase [Chloroflexota bacterium]
MSIHIRPLHPNDSTHLYPIITLPQVARNLLQVPSMDYQTTVEWIKKTPPFHHRFVAEWEGQVIGSANLMQSDRPRLIHSGRLGLYVHPHYWGRGVGSALMTHLLEMADNWLNLKRVELEVFTDNAAAIRLYEKFGFVPEGVRRKVAFRDGILADDLSMARLRDVAHLPLAEELPLTPKPAPLTLDTKVVIRPFRPEDAAALHEFFVRPDVTRTLNRLPYQEFHAFQENMTRRTDRGSHHLVAVVNEKAVGDIFLHQDARPRLKHSATLGMALHPDYWGLGIGSHLMSTALQLADQWLNLQRVELSVSSHNLTAIRLYQKHGFISEGTKHYQSYGNGRWSHSHFMARLRE